MRIVIIGLMFGSALGLVAGTTVSHYVSVAPKPGMMIWNCAYAGVDGRTVTVAGVRKSASAIALRLQRQPSLPQPMM